MRYCRLLPRAYCLPPALSFGKCAGAVFLDDGAVLGVEFGSVTKVFVHDRVCIVDVLGAEDMTQLVHQRHDLDRRFGVGPFIMKHRARWRDYITAQSLSAVADTVHSRPSGDKVAADAFGGESDDQIVVVGFRLDGKIFLQLGQHRGRGRDALDFGPRRYAFESVGGYRTRARNSPMPLRSSRALRPAQRGFLFLNGRSASALMRTARWGTSGPSSEHDEETNALRIEQIIRRRVIIGQDGTSSGKSLSK